MLKTILLSGLLLFIALAVSAQPKSKKWRITVIGQHFRTNGNLYRVTDSSIVLMFDRQRTDEINFADIIKIKLKPGFGGEHVAISFTSFLVEGIAGGVIIGTAMSEGKTGEPAAMSGVVGGIVGGLAVGITAAIVNPMIYNKIKSKKIYVHHDKIFYESLKLRLQPYCVVQ